LENNAGLRGSKGLDKLKKYIAAAEDFKIVTADIIKEIESIEESFWKPQATRPEMAKQDQEARSRQQPANLNPVNLNLDGGKVVVGLGLPIRLTNNLARIVSTPILAAPAHNNKHLLSSSYF
jgi:hypothetical protein